MPLSSQQIRSLRAESHRLKLKPVVIIGQQGLSENVLNELQSALTHHELMKVRIPALDKTEKKAFIGEVCQRLQAELIQTIGHIIVIFRQNPDNRRFERLLKA